MSFQCFSGPCTPLWRDSNSGSFLRLWGGAQRHWLPETQRLAKWRVTWHCGQIPVEVDGAGAKYSFLLFPKAGTQPSGVETLIWPGQQRPGSPNPGIAQGKAMTGGGIAHAGWSHQSAPHRKPWQGVRSRDETQGHGK